MAAGPESPSGSTLWKSANYFNDARSAIKVAFLPCSFSTAASQEGPFFKPEFICPGCRREGAPKRWLSCSVRLALCIQVPRLAFCPSWSWKVYSFSRAFPNKAPHTESLNIADISSLSILGPGSLGSRRQQGFAPSEGSGGESPMPVS